jgi:hypothetical protein
MCDFAHRFSTFARKTVKYRLAVVPRDAFESARLSAVDSITSAIWSCLEERYSL